MSFAVYPKPDACRALMPTPEPHPPGPPSRPMVCHMPKGHEGMHSLDRRPGPLSRRWDGDGRPPTPPSAVVPDPRFRDQLEATAHQSIQQASWARGVAMLDSDVAAFRQRLLEDLMPLVEARVQAAEQRGYERGRRDFQFEPEGDNHHNAALCPYCSPGAQAADNQRAELIRAVREDAWHEGYDTCRRGEQRHNPYRVAALASPAPAPHAEEGRR